MTGEELAGLVAFRRRAADGDSSDRTRQAAASVVTAIEAFDRIETQDHQQGSEARPRSGAGFALVKPKGDG